MPDYIIVNGELYHHGIKGMKWGVRRYENYDGSLTPAGKRRYGKIGNAIQKTETTVTNYSRKKISSHRTRLEKKYRESGMSEAEAKAAANRRIKVEKAIAVTAGVTVAACATYYARNKWISDHCDQILKSGTTFHNLDAAANPRPGEHLYVNYRKDDVNYFRGHFAVGKIRKSGHVFNHTLTTSEDIKIPSLNTRKSVFKQLFDNDPEFREVFNKHSWLPEGNKSAKVAYSQMWRKFGDKNDESFNIAKRKYFEALRQKGYEAIVDEYDTKASVFRSNAPLILLNTSSKSFGDMTIKELEAKDVLLAQANSKRWQTVRDAKNLATNFHFHTNHFKESNRSVASYAKKTAKNSVRINKVLDALGDDSQATTLALRRKGSVVAKAGKYMEKNSNLSVNAALSKAKTKDNVKLIAGFYGGVGAFYGSLYKVSKSMAVERYIADHPNTKLTTKEIEKLIIEQSKQKG